MTDLVDALGTTAAAPPTLPPVISLLVVEDDALLADLVTVSLRAAGISAEVCTASDPASIVEEARLRAAPVVLLDVFHSNCAGGAPWLVRSLRALGTEVIAFADAADHLPVAAVIEAGACEVVSPLAPLAELLEEAA